MGHHGKQDLKPASKLLQYDGSVLSIGVKEIQEKIREERDAQWNVELVLSKCWRVIEASRMEDLQTRK